MVAAPPPKAEPGRRERVVQPARWAPRWLRRLDAEVRSAAVIGLIPCVACSGPVAAAVHDPRYTNAGLCRRCLERLGLLRGAAAG